jgi:hypothetical protein
MPRCQKLRCAACRVQLAYALAPPVFLGYWRAVMQPTAKHGGDAPRTALGEMRAPAVAGRVCPQAGGAATEVARVSNLPYRGFPIRRRWEVRKICRLEVGDTADWKSALRSCRPPSCPQIRRVLGQIQQMLIQRAADRSRQSNGALGDRRALPRALRTGTCRCSDPTPSSVTA